MARQRNDPYNYFQEYTQNVTYRMESTPGEVRFYPDPVDHMMRDEYTRDLMNTLIRMSDEDLFQERQVVEDLPPELIDNLFNRRFQMRLRHFIQLFFERITHPPFQNYPNILAALQRYYRPREGDGFRLPPAPASTLKRHERHKVALEGIQKIVDKIDRLEIWEDGSLEVEPYIEAIQKILKEALEDE
jgi:hypothetical protein